jgi:hypothetical protein
MSFYGTEQQWCHAFTRTYKTCSKSRRFEVAEKIINAMREPNESLLPSAIELLGKGYTPHQIVQGFECPAC